MNRDDIIRMAREVNIEWDLIDYDEGEVWYITTETLERFAALVGAAEREACARLCEQDAEIADFWNPRGRDPGRWFADAIRARGTDD